jgi:hypothetical protein
MVRCDFTRRLRRKNGQEDRMPMSARSPEKRMVVLLSLCFKDEAGMKGLVSIGRHHVNGSKDAEHSVEGLWIHCDHRNTKNVEKPDLVSRAKIISQPPWESKVDGFRTEIINNRCRGIQTGI